MPAEILDELREENRELQIRLEEAEETIRAIRAGDVDAVVAAGPHGDVVYTLKGADETYRLLVQQMAEGAMTLTSDGLILFANDQAAALLGLPLERVIGSQIQDFVPPSCHGLLCGLLTAESGAKTELQLQRADGEFVPALLSAGHLQSDAMKCLMLVITNLTEQKRNEEIVAAGRLARSILEQVATSILVLDPGGRIIHANRATEQLAHAAVLLRPFSDVFHLHTAADGKELTFSEILATVQQAGTITKLHAILQVPKSADIEVLMNAGLLAGSESEVLGCTITFTDITEQIETEKRIQQMNDELEHRVRERTAQLEAANCELEAFAYSVSHDLRAPLRSIDGWSLALDEDYAKLLDSTGHKYLARVRSEAQRMGVLIDDLLHLSRITRAQMDRDVVDLAVLAETIASRLRESNPDRKIDFRIGCDLTCSGDARFLEIALTNLLSNAVKFTRPSAEARIELDATERNGEEKTFYVRDNGVGFDMKYANNLFGAFQRLHKVSEFPGTGIGLAIVHRIIRSHGGQIWAEAQPGKGATFFFTLGNTEL